MNKIQYFLFLILATSLFYTLDLAVVNIFFPDIGNAGWVPGQTFSKYFLGLYFIFASLYSGFRLHHLNLNKLWAVIPLAMLCVHLFRPYPLLLLGTIIFCVIAGFLPKRKLDSNEQTTSAAISIVKTLVIVTILLYISVGFWFLASPLKISAYVSSVESGNFIGPDCYDAKYINLFLFKTITKHECRGGI